MRSWAFEYRVAKEECERLRAIIREIISVFENEERTPEEMLLLERANHAVEYKWDPK